MAKWGEGDPRWIVEEREDAKNVNNWHWYGYLDFGSNKTCHSRCCHRFCHVPYFDSKTMLSFNARLDSQFHTELLEIWSE